MSGEMIDPATAAFSSHRSLLFTIAYEVLGSAADAEDVLQETWLRWVQVELEQVLHHRAYLMRITTRLALNRLRESQRRRETYVGEWLPEPLLTTGDVADEAEFAERVSMAMLLVLETLSPTERAVFVLREVFDVGYDEISAAIGKTQTAIRQITHRARSHVDARRPRHAVPASETRAVLASFRRAVEGGDLQELLGVLAPGVVLIADGGGLRQAALRPIVGADRVARFMLGGLGKAAAAGFVVTAESAVVNGGPAILLRIDGALDGVLTARVERGRIDGLYYVRNPEKLTRLDATTRLALR